MNFINPKLNNMIQLDWQAETAPILSP